jgi:hypothetical protein
MQPAVITSFAGHRVEHKKLKGGKIAKQIFNEVRICICAICGFALKTICFQSTAAAAELEQGGWKPSLLSIQIGDDEASGYYIQV